MIASAALHHDTILRRFLARAEATPDAVALRALAAGGAPADATTTWAAWRDEAMAVAAALVVAGVRPGDRVAVLAGNTMLWPIADIGILLAGAICVGIFPTSTATQCGDVLRDCGARVAIVDGAAQRDKLRMCGAPLTTLVTAEAPPPHAPNEIAWDDWRAAGHAALDGALPEIAARTARAAPEDVAGLIYTSGSTGEPKGACIPHAYVLASAESIVDALGLAAGDTALSLLPFAHAAERVFGHYTRIVAGMEGGLVADATRTWEAARAFAPTLFGGLPRFFEKAYDALRDAGDAADARTALARLFGDRLRLATSGGAPLPIDVATALDARGLTVLGAYGQTEHLCIAFHRPHDYAFDSVGRPMRSTELAFGDDGEILVRRSALTFGGYWGRPDATQEAFTDDGRWLRTGDVGYLDAHGRLVVSGRKKEMIALSTGKKVAPLPIEGRLAEHPSVAQAVVVGEGRKLPAALLFLRDGAAVDEAALDAHVADVNAALAPHEQVRRWLAVPHELTEADGELTPTLKVKRAVIASRYADLLERLFT